MASSNSNFISEIDKELVSFGEGLKRSHEFDVDAKKLAHEVSRKS